MSQFERRLLALETTKGMCGPSREVRVIFAFDSAHILVGDARRYVRARHAGEAVADFGARIINEARTLGPVSGIISEAEFDALAAEVTKEF